MPQSSHFQTELIFYLLLSMLNLVCVMFRWRIDGVQFEWRRLTVIANLVITSRADRYRVASVQRITSRSGAVSDDRQCSATFNTNKLHRIVVHFTRNCLADVQRHEHQLKFIGIRVYDMPIVSICNGFALNFAHVDTANLLLNSHTSAQRHYLR